MLYTKREFESYAKDRMLWAKRQTDQRLEYVKRVAVDHAAGGNATPVERKSCLMLARLCDLELWERSHRMP